MDSADLYHRYQELQRYVGWELADAVRVRTAGPVLARYFTPLIQDFYEEIERHPEARQVITGGAAQIERLKGSLHAWVEELFRGTYDAEYVLRRWQVGLRHVQVGLHQAFVNAAMSRLRMGILQFHEQALGTPDAEAFATRRAINKLIDLDLAIIEDAYQTEFLARQQRNERLIVVGQVSAGIAHELRNPLNVIKTSIYYLRNARQVTPEKLESHLERIERQSSLADKVITALHDFARLPQPKLHAVPIEAFLQETANAAQLPETIDLKVECESGLPDMQADRDQLRIVLDNLIRNAREAMPDGGSLIVSAVEEPDGAAICVADTGIGMNAEELQRIKEPFRSTKARGLGLGLAISRAIIEKHGGRLEVASQLGAGSAFTVHIPFHEPSIDISIPT
jgi:signal transduction histidine kinase